MIRPPVPAGAPLRRPADEGVLDVLVADEQDAQEVERARWQALARSVLEAEGVSGRAELALLFVDEATMAELNGTFMGQHGATDVLAFPIDAIEATDGVDEAGVNPSRIGSTGGPESGHGDDLPRLLGDVVICPAVAASNAPDHAGTYVDEVALLIVHGVLHVLGMDHAETGEAARMQQREHELIERFHRSHR